MIPRWVSLSDAMKYCQIIGEHQLIKIVRSGVIEGGRRPWDNRKAWFVDLKSLDKYLEAECLNVATVEILAVRSGRRVSAGLAPKVDGNVSEFC